MADQESIDTALLVWVNLFDGCKDVTDLTQLRNGNYIARMFSAMHPKHAVNEVENEHNNWMLSQAMLDDVVRELSVVLSKYSFDQDVMEKVDRQKIARDGDLDQIRELLKLMLITLPGSKMDKRVKIALVNDYPDDDEILQVLLMNLYDKYELQLDEHLSDTNGMMSTRMSMRTHSSFAFPSPRKSHFTKPADYESKIEQLQKEMAALRSENLSLWQENAMLKDSQLPDDTVAATGEHITPLTSPTSPRVGFDKTRVADALKMRDAKINDLEKSLNEAEIQLLAKEEELQEALCQEGKREKGQIKKLKDQRNNLAEENRKLKLELDRELGTIVELEKELKQARVRIRDLEGQVADGTAMETAAGLKEEEPACTNDSSVKSRPEVMETPVTIASPALTEPVEEPHAASTKYKGPRRLPSCTLEMIKLNERLKERNKSNKENHIKPIMELVTQLTSQTKELKEKIEQQQRERLRLQPEYPYFDRSMASTARATLTTFPLDSHRSIHQTISEKISSNSFCRRPHC
eukprot:TRINITY_DN19665_c0_g1_i2.p1 TRINITY_DN19665_c0_g1~~TRINITY_DN19665_c0_g1_i2.p1  ORF type:complete len:531 (+),score=152.95 TRINITY_DN19665_c0_g1_i2:29-1594(+)